MVGGCGRKLRATTWSGWSWRLDNACTSSHCGRAGSAKRLPNRTRWWSVADLQGKVVAFLEGRRTTELGDLIQRHHGVPLAAPCLREVHRPEAASLQKDVAMVCDA